MHQLPLHRVVINETDSQVFGSFFSALSLKNVDYSTRVE